MRAHLPAWVFVGTTGGSGPLVTFERPVTVRSRRGRLSESVTFQKGLHGADWFRVTLSASYEGPAATGTMHHVRGTTTLGEDVSWTSGEELVVALDAQCKKLERRASTFFQPFEKSRARMDALYGDLLKHYGAWLRTEGSALPIEGFWMPEEEPNRIPAYEAFERWVRRKRLTAGLRDVDLWPFWHEGRPMREIDYEKDDYYDCSKCSAFVRRARARLEKLRVPGFGTAYALVCKKHS
jgi:hypothetical protein